MKRQLKSNRFLPDYVTSFKDRHGKLRLRFRRKGYLSHYFSAALGTEAFREEYRACLDGAPVAIASRAAPGTIADLVGRYCNPATRLGPTVNTQRKIRAILEKFCEGRGDRPVAGIRFEHIDAILAKKRVKVQVGSRWEGGTDAARKLRKELVRLFDFAIKIGMLKINPVDQADRIKVAPGEASKGFHTWTEAEIAQYRAYHGLGTKPRLAMELMLWTGQRRIDAIRMGRQHIRDGHISFDQSKGGKHLRIPVAPQLLQAIVAMPAADKGHLCFLVTATGKPFSNPGFGNWFRDQCDDAGLPQCTAHGLRKATMRRMAELGGSNQSLKSVSGHINDSEVATYTRAVDQARMAENAIAALAQWEKSNLSEKLDTASSQGVESA